ncbi:MAG TPA: hypothetical protein VJJ23_03165 [Candidatus Nanoarchaeia archaeon]|nr:hypothetical protein [Candidatus Nanoarchaeia archaeon]
MKTVTVPKEVFNKILSDVETLIDDVEIALDEKIQQRIFDIESRKTNGKTEEDLNNYLKKRGVKIE